MRGFEVYQRGSSRWAPRAEVTISSRKQFLLNRRACEMLGNPAAVVLLHDRAENLIGFRPAKRSKEAFTMRVTGSASRVVSAAAFCDFLGLDTSAARRWPLEQDEDGTCYIDLSKPGRVVTSNRKKARDAD